MSDVGVTYGSSSLTAIHDSLLVYDPVAGTYEPHLAKSIESNDDYTTWTLHLREGVDFSDGTPLDAEAVVAHIKRCRANVFEVLLSRLASMKAVDPLTVQFQMTGPWKQFPFALTVGPGLVASPTAVEKWGADYGQHPTGAGPFVFDHLSPGEELVLTANPDYWGEGPYLEKLRFVPLGGGQINLDALKEGGVQAAVFRNPEIATAAHESGYGGFVDVASSAEVLLINSSEGRPGANPKVRQAISYAFNPEQYNQRVYEGLGMVQAEMMAAGSRWSGTQANPYDPDKAEKLVEQAKSEGFDGKVSITYNSAPTREAAALAIQAQLNAVGFDATLDATPSIVALVKKVRDGNYDLGFYGIEIHDAAPGYQIDRTLRTGAPTNRVHYSNPEMDAALDDLRNATSDEAIQDALNEIQEIWNQTVPLLSLAAVGVFISWDDSVHGVTFSSQGTPILSQAWLSE